MLNDYLITTDVIALLEHYVQAHPRCTPALHAHLSKIASTGNKVSYADWWRTLALASETLAEPCLGLAVGGNVRATQCGVLGYLFRTSRTALNALYCFARFERLLYAGSAVQSEVHGDTLCLTWNNDNGLSTQLSDELLLAALVSVLREINAPRAFHPVSIDFAHSVDRARLDRYQHFFSCDVRHAQPALSIGLPMAALQHPLAHEDAALHSLLNQQANEQLSQLPVEDAFLARFRKHLSRGMHAGSPTADYVAAALATSPRSMHRALQQRNRLFRTELKALRISLAEQYLRDPALSLAEIALLLGYGEQSVFQRAFREWFGKSPAKWRREIE